MQRFVRYEICKLKPRLLPHVRKRQAPEPPPVGRKRLPTLVHLLKSCLELVLLAVHDVDAFSRKIHVPGERDAVQAFLKDT